jgi:hypothetical protein
VPLSSANRHIWRHCCGRPWSSTCARYILLRWITSRRWCHTASYHASGTQTDGGLSSTLRISRTLRNSWTIRNFEGTKQIRKVTDTARDAEGSAWEPTPAKAMFRGHFVSLPVPGGCRSTTTQVNQYATSAAGSRRRSSPTSDHMERCETRLLSQAQASPSGLK